MHDPCQPSPDIRMIGDGGTKQAAGQGGSVPYRSGRWPAHAPRRGTRLIAADLHGVSGSSGAVGAPARRRTAPSLRRSIGPRGAWAIQIDVGRRDGRAGGGDDGGKPLPLSASVPAKSCRSDPQPGVGSAVIDDAPCGQRTPLRATHQPTLIQACFLGSCETARCIVRVVGHAVAGRRCRAAPPGWLAWHRSCSSPSAHRVFSVWSIGIRCRA